MAIRKETTHNKKEPNSILSNLEPQKVVQDTTNIVKKAAEILEENLSAGIIAAKKLEERIIDVDSVRSLDEKKVMSRFRKDAHEVLDIFFDALVAATDSLSSLTQRVASTTSDLTSPEKKAPTNQAVPIIQPDKPLTPGSTEILSIMLENDSPEEQRTIALVLHALLNSKGESISTRQVGIDPKELVLAPGAKEKVSLTVKVPKSAKPGTYSGLLQDKNLSSLRIMLLVEVSDPNESEKAE